MRASSRTDEGLPLDPALLWILRIGVAWCFVGHGSLGLNQTAAWSSYFGVAGIGQDRAIGLMPWVGTFDWIMGLSVLFVPARAVVLYMTAWCVWTALLRPFAGESFWEAVERAGNYGVPLALLFLFAPGSGLKNWFPGRFREVLDAAQTRTLGWILRLTTVLLLLGHGMLGASVIKPALGMQYSHFGLPGATVTPWVGAFECLLAVAVLIRPTRGLLFAVLLWKLATEALSPMTGSPLWVFIEHGGSYAAPLALAYLSPQSHPVRTASATAPAH